MTPTGIEPVLPP